MSRKTSDRKNDAQKTSIEALAKQQGVKPLDFDSLRAKADFWPEDESIDDFIATVRRWRDEEDQREQP